ncbi:MAG: ribonuclease HII [Patescibacteria group bacterium]|nr:ribonuclease HII [Patescibacteria group bacterium]MDE2015636.1 ribonuclease HII [Patescibacteria group bacterium]MDE2226693.1 ribonuclease HII [Patescibacteria group bacterium]
MKFIIGIDEVGRGSLAGPVTVAVACMPWNLKIINRSLGKLRDSKKLTAKQRERWFNFFKNHNGINCALARVFPRQIEKINISQAANLAALRAYKKLNFKLKISNAKIFLDGGLFLGRGEQPKNAKTVIRGDEKIRAVSIASIIAKVSRDRAMVRLARVYPQYGFDVNKGYGTRKHLKAIKKHGPSKVHRLTFLRFS